jgi:predicted nucleotidyltransferase
VESTLVPRCALPDELLELIEGDPSVLPDLLQEHGVSVLALFGSTAKRKRHPRSDLDLAVVFDRTPEPPGPASGGPDGGPEAGSDAWSRIIELDIAIEEALQPKCPLNLVALETASPLLRKEVAEHGVLLFEAAPGAWLERRIRYFRNWELEEKFHRRAVSALRAKYASRQNESHARG